MDILPLEQTNNTGAQSPEDVSVPEHFNAVYNRKELRIVMPQKRNSSETGTLFAGGCEDYKNGFNQINKNKNVSYGQ